VSPVSSPRILLRRLGLRPKKSLGQHFLVHPHQARRLAAALELGSQETVVEIGAGLGALTLALADAAGRVVALEKDPALVRYLQEELFPGSPQVEVVCQDVLEFDFLGLSRRLGEPLAVAGNLPYQITSPLLFKLMAELPAVSRAVLMMQQEVGDRLVAPPGTKDYGILSVLIQYHFFLERLFTLSPANFYPPPQVSSVVLALKPGSLHPRVRDEALLARVVKAAFGHRRKNLNNTLAARAQDFGLSREEMRAVLERLGIDPLRRGETLGVAEFVALSNAIGDKAAT
jgi:16S rRNA (adenine1518-N6/adenine1519-N6)-dimethyltransferase